VAGRRVAIAGGGVLLVVGLAVGAVVAVTAWRPRDRDGGRGEVVDRAGGFALRPPAGWIDGGVDAADGVRRFEQPRALGLFRVRGLWVSRWSAPKEARDALVAEPRPSVVGRAAGVPASLDWVEVRYRMVRGPLVYELGFWGPRTDVGGATERAVVRSFRLLDPAPRTITGDGFSVRVPGTWSVRPPEGRNLALAFGPDDPVPAEWLYVIRLPSDRGTPLAVAAARLAGELQRSGRVEGDVRTSGHVTVDGHAAVRLDFDYRDLDPPPGTPPVSTIAEYVVDAGRHDGGFLLVALGRRAGQPVVEGEGVLAGFSIR
jgi:hypothetical protein